MKFRWPSEIKRGYKACSKSCANKRLGITQKNNKERYAILDRIRGYRKFGPLSEEHKRKIGIASKRTARYGETNNLWKGGISKENNRLRQTAEFKNWRKAVYKRDNYICQECGQRKELHAHHIKPFSKHPKLRFDLSNGITLCFKHHADKHPQLMGLYKKLHG